MRILALLLTLMELVPGISRAQEKEHFKREENFPSGEQTNRVIGSFLSGIKDYNVVTFTFEAPYEAVWPAVKYVADAFAKTGGRPLAGIDEGNGRVQLGRINQDAMVGMGSGAWLDEFVIEATSPEAGTTKVSVVRKVVEKELTGSHAWRTQASNGKLERYLLTRIEEQIKILSSHQQVFPSVGESPAAITDYAQSAPGKYVNKDNATEYMELNADGTFFLKERGKGYAGKYQVSGSELTVVLPSGKAARVRIGPDTMWDEDGKTWVRTAASSASLKAGEVLTNADVVRMVQAKLPEDVIVAKVRTSSSKFNTSADSLIQLKQAGVTDAIIKKAMLESRPK